MEAGGLVLEAEEEEEVKYTETIFNRELRAYLKIYTGQSGGKFFYNNKGDKKYLSEVQRTKVVIKNVEVTDVKDFKPVLKADNSV